MKAGHLAWAGAVVGGLGVGFLGASAVYETRSAQMRSELASAMSERAAMEQAAATASGRADAATAAMLAAESRAAQAESQYNADMAKRFEELDELRQQLASLSLNR